MWLDNVKFIIITLFVFIEKRTGLCKYDIIILVIY